MGDVKNVGALLTHIQDMQDLAIGLEGLLAIACELDRRKIPNIHLAPLMEVMHGRSVALVCGLDVTSLPEVRR